jgi:hypothetical protein
MNLQWLLAPTLLLLGLSAEGQTQTVNDRIPGDEVPLILLGDCDREGLERGPFYEFFQPAESTMETETAAELSAALEDVSLLLFLGTWCEDSQEQVPVLWAELEASGFPTREEEPGRWHMVCVNEAKSEPAELISERSVEFVPTLIVLRQGEEIGRVVETPELGWGVDILRLLQR